MNIRNFTVFGSLFFSGVLALGACGSSSSSGTGGTTGSLGGTVGGVGGTTGSAGGHIGSAGGTVGSAGGSIGTGTGGAPPVCASIPSCLEGLVNCLPSGTCTRQTTGSIATSGTVQDNTCYSNGVKAVTMESFDITTSAVSFTATYSKGGTTCFTESFEDSGAGGATATPVITIKNSSGTAVATLTDSPDGSGTLVTCPGQAPVVLPDCVPAGSMGTTGDCTDGVCQ